MNGGISADHTDGMQNEGSEEFTAAVDFEIVGWGVENRDEIGRATDLRRTGRAVARRYAENLHGRRDVALVQDGVSEQGNLAFGIDFHVHARLGNDLRRA